MENPFQADVINWLRQGNEIEAAMIMEKCDIEFHFVDLAWELGTEREFMINDITISAPRTIYDQVMQKSSNYAEQIEHAIRASVSADMHVIRNIHWGGKPDNQVESPIHTMTLEALKKIGVERVKLDWQRTLTRLPNDPEGAITAARTLFESTCKLILDDSKITYNNNDDLPRLYRKVADSLNLAPDKQLNDTFRRIFGGAQTIIAGIAEMRNQLGDAHGKAQQIALPEPRYATLAVNLAGTLALFLIETWQAKVAENPK